MNNNQICIKGKGCISAKIIADSISFNKNKRIITFELEYPRFIHSEFMTHRLFSRNCASSRAIPVKTMLEIIKNNPAMPIFWGKNQSGMQAIEEISDYDKFGQGEYQWLGAMEHAIQRAKTLNEQNYHKQIVNRLLEPFQIMKTVVTATEYDNFFFLRCHKDAQPEIQELANCMYSCQKQSIQEILYEGEWHTPYVKHFRDDNNILHYGNDKNNSLTLHEARIISASCCAQTSYRKNDDTYEKALIIFDKLINSRPCHASPVEHQATPVTKDWEAGITHVDNNNSFWSGNFKEWIQYRQLIPDNVCWNYENTNKNIDA